LYNCNNGQNQQWFLALQTAQSPITDGCGACRLPWCKGPKAPPSGGGGILSQVQIWAKPQPNSGYAVLLISASPEKTKPHNLAFDKLNMT
jgi:hypothetical protein